MGFLQSLARLGRKKSRTGERTDAHHRLLQLKHRHIFISVTFAHPAERFRSLVLDLDPEAGHLILDELYPPAAAHQLLEGEMAEIASDSRELSVSFSSRFLARRFRDGSPVYLMELPEDLHISHSRNAYRVSLLNEQDLGISVEDNRGQALEATIVNMSAEGIKLSVAGDACSALERSAALKNCVIHLPNGFDVDCQIDARNVFLMRSPNEHTLVGGKLQVSEPQQAVKLAQYLAAVQRRQRRMEARLG